MSAFLIGTERGVFQVGNDGTLWQEEGPPTVAFLACAHEGVVAVTPQGALWHRTGEQGWRRVHERPVAEDIWAVAADPRVAGRLYVRGTTADRRLTETERHCVASRETPRTHGPCRMRNPVLRERLCAEMSARP